LAQTTKGAAELAAPQSLAELKGRFGRPRATVPLYLDADAVATAAALERVLERAVALDESSNEPDRAPEIRRQLQAVRERAEASRVEFELQAISHRAWSRMLAEHPPTQEQLDAAPVNAKPEFNIDTVPGALVRAQLMTPKVGSDEEWDGFWDELSDGQMAQLWGNARALQLSDGSLGKSTLAFMDQLSSDDS
jgi:hypothetical protein